MCFRHWRGEPGGGRGSAGAVHREISSGDTHTHTLVTHCHMVTLMMGSPDFNASSMFLFPGLHHPVLLGSDRLTEGKL